MTDKTRPSRRDAVKLGIGASAASAGVTIFGLGATPVLATPLAATGVDLDWLGGATAQTAGGVVWGVPWPRGALIPATELSLIADGTPEPLQTWPLAYWPDGSLKWTGHAASGLAGAARLRVEPGRAPPPRDRVTVHEASDAVTIRSGDLVCVLGRSSGALIRSIALSGRETLRNGRLVCLRRDRPEADAEEIRTETFQSEVRSAVVEQSGPVRAVVRIEGFHRSGAGRDWLPFSVRLAVDAGGGIKLVHTFTFDGGAASDFISGLGVRFDAPMTDELHNRHFRLVGEGDGVWGEAVRNLPGWQPGKFALAARFADQLDGRRTPDLASMDAKTREQLESVPVFGDVKLFQHGSDQFELKKRTKPGQSWIKADHGGRASGAGYVGGVSGGVAFGLRDFWQRHPTAIEITGAAGEAATVTLWLWSPDAGAMDLRHYSDGAHGLDIQYEDVQPGFSTPMGIARTSEINLWALPATPTRAELVKLAGVVCEPPLLVASPEHYHAVGAFGVWALPDRSTPVKTRLENDYDALIAFYRHEVDQRDWYGFWDYGDIMHTYDNDRHAWRYDVGGYAWDNSEMVPDKWLWYAFLRTGKAETFRFAEAMTRHTSEVDMHHLGRFAGLGTRHNVSHWGDGAKEARISSATLRRFYHYLTADERTGDLMRMVVNADHALLTTNPIRQILPPSPHPTQARTGPDWFAFAGNWMTEWERTGDVKWRDKIVLGMRSIAGMPHGLFTGPPMGYDPATGQLYDIGYDVDFYYLMVMIFGGAEVLFELDGLLDVPEFDAALVAFAEAYNLMEPERIRAVGPKALNPLFGSDNIPSTVWYARMTAWAAHKKNDPALARRAWMELLGGRGGTLPGPSVVTRTMRVEGPAVLEPRDEIRGLQTNNSAQWSLNYIQLLALVGDHAPANLDSRWT